MSRPGPDASGRLPPGEILLIGSVPFSGEEEAAPWLARWPLRIDVRAQYPSAGPEWSMIGEVGRSSFARYPGAGAVAVKDQIVGPWTYREACERNGEDAASALARLESDVVERLELIRGFPLTKILVFDEPSLVLPGANHPADEAAPLLRKFLELVSAKEILAGIHCCQRTLSGAAERALEVLPFDVISLPLTEGNEAILARLYGAGRTICLGLDLRVLQSGTVALRSALERLAVESGLSFADVACRTLFSPECGFGTLSREEAEEHLRLLVQLRDSFFTGGFLSSTR